MITEGEASRRSPSWRLHLGGTEDPRAGGREGAGTTAAQNDNGGWSTSGELSVPLSRSRGLVEVAREPVDDQESNPDVDQRPG